MPENSELTPFLPFTLSEKKRMPERQSIAYIRSGTAPVLSFRSKQALLEPEDARITGATRSLYRRLLALNLRKPAVAVSQLDTVEPYMPPMIA